MKKVSRIVRLSLIVLMAGATFASAQMGGMEHGADMKMEKMEHHEGHGEEAMSWKKTLTEDQKMKADKMHLELKKAMDVLEAKVKLKEAELNTMVTKDKPDTNAIHGKINEIAELKKEMMTKKYDHIVEMRSILTPEQRVSFDLGISGWTHHEGRH
ncbi:MAG: periplasmic heavy metal sensor [Deltaproteobacteria bacterium]|nr:periplasmic heavy metal sensor [Deltaproteobacteria bacterium]